MQQTRPIAIIFANLKGNLGDYAILHAILVDLQIKRSGHPVHVYSQPFVEIDEARYKKFSSLAPPFEYKGTTFEDEKTKMRWLKAARFFKLRSLYQSRRIKRLGQISAKSAAHFADYAEIYVAGGAQWTGDHAGVSMFGSLNAITLSNKNVYSYPISVSESLNKLGSPRSLRASLSQIKAPFIVRDSGSQERLQALGLNPSLGVDCVFSLAEIAAKVPSSRQTETQRVMLVLTNVREDLLAATLQQLAKTTYDVALLSTCEREDRAVQKRVADRYGLKFIAPETWQDVVAEMKGSEIVVTNRLHGLILASFADVAVIPLVNRSKVRGVAKDACLPIVIDSLAALDQTLLDGAIDNKKDLVAGLSKYRDAAHKNLNSPVEYDEV